MQRPLQITSRDFQLTPAMEAQIRERAEDYPQMTSLNRCVAYLHSRTS